MLLGTAVLCAVLGFSGWMITIGQSFVGVATLLAEATVLIGAIIYGRFGTREDGADGNPEEAASEHDDSGHERNS